MTELDLFAPLPDPEDLLRDDDDRRGPGKDPTLLDFGTSQLLTDSQTPSRREKTTLQDDIDVDLDFGLEPDEAAVRSSPMTEDRSVEIGRRAQTPRRDEPTLLDDMDLGLDFGNEGDTTINRGTSLRPPQDDNDMPMIDADDGFQMPPDVDDGIAAANEAAFKRAENAAARRQRDSASPLSFIRSSVERDLEQTYHLDQNMETEDSTMVQAAQRVKRRKVMRPDAETQLHNSQIKKQQEDRSGITKAPSFLSHDPVMLQLMEMQRNGSFVSNLMGDGRMAGWAPELRGILSLEVVRQAGEKKRKRDSGVADVTDDERQETPQLEVPEDEDFPVDAGAADFGGDALRSDGIVPQEDDGVQLPGEDFQEDFAGSPGPGFDTTEAPILHPSQAGPVSLGTKNAVHLLRSHFAPDHPASATEPPTPSKRTKGDALFTDLCPENQTSRQDATKMFFELLVLGTKDAVKVEQETGEIGMPIRVRGKRGLWGDWAAREAGGEIAGQGEGEGMLPSVEEQEA